MNKFCLIQTAGKDPIFRQLLGQNWSRVFIYVFVSYCLVFFPILMSWHDGSFINKSLKIDALHDYGYFNQYAILLPFLVLFIPYYLNGLEEAFLDIRQNGIIRMTDHDYEKFVNKANEVFANHIVSFVPYIMTILAIIIIYFSFWSAGHNTWNSPPNGTFTLSAIASFLPTIFLYHLFAGFVVRTIAVCIVIRKFLSHKVSIQPLHPDKAGGLAALGEFSLRVSAAGLFVGVCCLIGIFVNFYSYKLPLLGLENITILISYIVGLSIVFFIPLLSARDGMRKSKSETLKLINESFNNVMADAMKKLENSETSDQLPAKKIDDINKIYQIANKMPIYPFNTSNIVKFGSSILWPIVLVIVQWGIGKY